jgi:hypothetical protein
MLVFGVQFRVEQIFSSLYRKNCLFHFSIGKFMWKGFIGNRAELGVVFYAIIVSSYLFIYLVECSFYTVMAEKKKKMSLCPLIINRHVS